MRKKGGPEFECLKISFSFALFEFLPFSVSVLLLSLRCYKFSVLKKISFLSTGQVYPALLISNY